MCFAPDGPLSCMATHEKRKDRGNNAFQPAAMCSGMLDTCALMTCFIVALMQHYCSFMTVLVQQLLVRTQDA